jgi:competence protein ComEC
MSLMLLFAPVCMRKYNAMNAVAATAVILLLINPFYLQDIGFQFSFSAVFGILIGYSRLKEFVPLDPKNPILKYMIDMLGVSLSAALFTAPVAMFYFNSLQLMSMFLNLLVIPLTFVVMITAIICLPCIFLPSFISDLFIHALDIALDVFRGVLRLASRSSMWTIHLSSFWKPLAMGILLILLFLLVCKSQKLKMFSCILILCLSIIWFFNATRPELIQLSLDRGHAIIYRRMRQALLINTGAIQFNSNDYDRSIEPVLDHFGIRDVAIIITKWEKNKYSNIPAIQRQYPECLVYIPQVESDMEENSFYICDGQSIVFADQDIFVDRTEDELNLSFSFGKEILSFQNEGCDSFPNIKINKNDQEVLHLKLYGKYIHIKE